MIIFAKNLKLKGVSLIFIFVLAAIFCSTANGAGEVDPTFSASVHGNLNGSVYVSKLQPDGKLLVGGQFTEVQGYAASGLARLNADGSVDTTFNAPDFISHNGNNGQLALGGDIYAIAVQPDGKILVGGSIYIGTFDNTGVKMGIRRLNPDGSLDTTFFTELLNGGSIVYDIKLLPDGKILLGGSFSVASNSATRNLARLNADGTRDTTFSANIPNTRFRELEIQNDGKIIAGGIPSSGSPAVLRFNADGSNDSSFSLVTSGGEAIQAVELQADGKIIIGGEFIFTNGVRGYMSHLNTDGTFDSTFNPGIGNTSVNAVVNDIFLKADGKIIIGGGFTLFSNTEMRSLARLNNDGTLDNTFMNSGLFMVVNDVEILPDNRIIAGINAVTSPNSLLRYSADGVLDSSFVVRVNKGGTVNEILQQPDGKILVAGEFLYGNNVQRRSLVRFNADGTLDTSFVPYFNNVSPLPIIYALALQPDGKIIVGAWHGIVLQRLNPDGSQDTSFTTPLTSSSQIYDVAVQSDGKILAGGNLTSPTLSQFARFNANGSRDTTFNPQQPNGRVHKIIIQPDGKFLIGGVFGTISDIAVRSGVARYNADGGLDNNFNPPNPNITVLDMDLQSDGKVVIAGTGFRRLNANGTLDVSGAGANSSIDAVKVQPDGKILLGGGFSLVNGVARNGIARLNANFTLDQSFTPFANRNVSEIQLQTDGKILIGGGFSKISGISGVRLARLLNAPVPQRTLFDYDGDGRADVSVFRPSENRWYIFRSSDGSISQQVFAIAGDKPVPADFDGDGKTDLAIFRSNGDWWSLASSNNAQVTANLGNSGDIKLPSDFDGDGRADYIIFRPSNNFWYRLSSANGTSSNKLFGASGDKPVSGDFDGDSKSDVAIFRPSTGDWWWQSSVDNVQRATRWGISTDIPAPADYDGDGKTDFAVYRPSTGVWYILNSSSGQATIMAFGLAEDKPVAADYDGDGKADIAVFRPSTGIWYLQRSTAGFAALQFGVSSDVPTPNAFIQ